MGEGLKAHTYGIKPFSCIYTESNNTSCQFPFPFPVQLDLSLSLKLVHTYYIQVARCT